MLLFFVGRPRKGPGMPLGAPGDFLDGPRVIPRSTKTSPKECLDRPREPHRTLDTHPTMPPRWFLGCPKNGPQLDPIWPCTHGITWDDIPWISMGYMYPMDIHGIHVSQGDLHGIHISHGSMGCMHPLETSMGYICSTEFHVIRKLFFCETMPRLFAIVGRAPLGSY